MITAFATLVIFALVAGGGLLGLYLRSAMPEHHRSLESRDVVKLGMGLIGTMSALILGLELSSAKQDYDDTDQTLKQIISKISYLDRVLANFGPETREAREQLRAAVTRGFDQMWSLQKGMAGLPTPTAAGGEMLLTQIHQLPSDAPLHTALKAEAAATTTEIGKIRWLMFAQDSGSHSVVFVVVVVAWLVIVFTGFGMLGSPNATVIGTLLMSAMSVAVAIGLIMELNRPFSGLLRLSPEPALRALELLGK